MLVQLCACAGSSASGGSSAGSSSAGSVSSGSSSTTAYAIPELRLSGFDSGQAETEGAVSADFSGLSNGYVAVSAVSDKRLKFQVIRDSETYNYDLPGDGTPTVYPLNMGDGEYTFRVMENVSEDKYAQLWKRTEQVAMADEFEPFLRPSQMVNYTADSQCVALARSLAADCTDDVAVVSAVYDYLVEHVAYDEEKAKTVQSGYLPDPDDTLKTGMGICFDYAALAAAMLRSVGIPCKMITGYVDPEEIYHSWDMIYLQNQGWITVEIKVSSDNWKRIDTTFAAGGVDSSRLNDDGLYTQRYVY